MPQPKERFKLSSRTWAALVGPHGIRVNAVAPGVIDTDMSHFAKTETGKQIALGIQALKRIGKPEDVADVVVFLCLRWCALDHRREHSRRWWVEAVRS